jgi:hypothetical protein
MGYRIFGEVYLFRAGNHCLAYATNGCRNYDFWVGSPNPSVMHVKAGGKVARSSRSVSM